MTYGDTHGETEFVHTDGTKESVELGSRRFFELADQRFYGWNQHLHSKEGYFTGIFDYQMFRGRRVLEIGCGMGCMAMNWAQQGADITAVDLNPVAIEQTKRRFEVFGLEGNIFEADAENLPLPDDQFDFVYSWGVLHHTPGISAAIKQLRRVLSPGGRVGLMLYNRRSFLYRYTISFAEGWLNLENEFLNELQLASRYGDGAREEGNPHTWPVTESEIRNDLLADFGNVKTRVFGTDVPPILDSFLPRLSQRLSAKKIDQLMQANGWSIWMTGEKPSA